MKSFRELLDLCGGEVKLGLMLDRLKTDWPCLVKPVLARRTRPVAYEEGVLVVSCSSSSVVTALKMDKRGILTALQRLGYPIRDIRAVGGGSFQERPIEVKPMVRKRKPVKRSEPDPEEVRRAEERLRRHVLDPEVLRAMARLMALWSKSGGRGA
ncbi:MAG: DUF721 domain-containing protein [Thermanaerothrix sp.]|nr:DUF721 domain-containing protein [Thermanaerothrix sp.]